MSGHRSAAGGGVGLGGVLFFVFLILKLTGAIEWSWWWVTAPLWIPVAVSVGFFLGAGLVILMAKAVKR